MTRTKRTSAKPSDVSENTIIGAKTVTTMKGELIMDGSNNGERLMTSEGAAQEKERAEEKTEKTETGKIIVLNPEYSDDTQFSGEVLDEVEQFRNSRD